MKNRSIAASMAVFALLAGCNAAPTTPVDDDSSTSTDATVDGGTAPSEDFTAFFEDVRFSITYPVDWSQKGVTAEEKDSTWSFGTAKTMYFKTEGGVDIFAVTLFTKDQWATVDTEDGPKPTVIAEKDGLVWAYAQTQDGTGVQDLLDELPQVLASFQTR